MSGRLEETRPVQLGRRRTFFVLYFVQPHVSKLNTIWWALIGKYCGALYLDYPLNANEMSLQQQQAECVVCGNAAFDLLDGLYFCSECGTQSQVQSNIHIRYTVLYIIA